MASFTELGPVYLTAAISIVLYFLYRLPKLMRKSEVTNESKVNGKSYTAQALDELAKSTPNFSPLVAIMRDELKRAGAEKILAGRSLITQLEELTGRGFADASTFGRLCPLYVDVIKRTEGAGK